MQMPATATPAAADQLGAAQMSQELPSFHDWTASVGSSPDNRAAHHHNPMTFATASMPGASLPPKTVRPTANSRSLPKNDVAARSNASLVHMGSAFGSSELSQVSTPNITSGDVVTKAATPDLTPPDPSSSASTPTLTHPKAPSSPEHSQPQPELLKQGGLPDSTAAVNELAGQPVPFSIPFSGLSASFAGPAEVRFLLYKSIQAMPVYVPAAYWALA